MANLVSIPVLIFLMILQSSVVSRLQLLGGTADLMLIAVITWNFQERVENGWLWAVLAGLIFGFVSTIPFYVPLLSYLIVVGIIRILKGRIWKLPVITLLVVTLIGTAIEHFISLVVLYFSGVSLPFGESLRVIIIPSMLLNLVFAFLLYWMMRDLSDWIYPAEVDYE